MGRWKPRLSDHMERRRRDAKPKSAPKKQRRSSGTKDSSSLNSYAQELTDIYHLTSKNKVKPSMDGNTKQDGESLRGLELWIASKRRKVPGAWISRCRVCGEPAIPGDNVCFMHHSK